MTATTKKWDVTGWRVLVTGASSGLGLAMARALVSSGARVAFGGRDAQRLRAAIDESAVGTAEGLAVSLDVRDQESIARAIATIEDAWGGLDRPRQ